MYISKDVKEFVKKRLYEFYYILKNAMCFSFFLLFFWLTNTYLETKRKVNLCFVPVYD